MIHLATSLFTLILIADRVSSSIFTSDARFVLSGSDDGNVRIWKANASEKLGVVTARERAAIEYRNSLKARWKMDSDVGKVARCVLFHPYERISLNFVGRDIYLNPSTKLGNSNERCWKREE